jgi:hypothetical protein
MSLLLDVSTLGVFFGFVQCYCIISADYLHASYNWITGVNECIEPASFDEASCAAYNECQKSFNSTKTNCLLIVGLGIFVLESFISNLAMLNFVSSFAIVGVFVTVIAILVRLIQTLSSGNLPFSEIQWVRPSPAVPYVPTLKAVLVDLPSFFSLFTI